jgi:hypothetical protein
MFRQGIGLLGLLAATTMALECAYAQSSNSPPPRYELTADGFWHLNAPRGIPFDASALLLRTNGDLWTLSDRGPTPYRIERRTDTHVADLVAVPGIFTSEQLKQFASQKRSRYDSEGLAQDEQGRIYLSEETDRWILRFDPRSNSVERLNIDWTSVRRHFYALDPNASLEGVAFGGGRLYVANERQAGRIIVVDPKTWKVLDDFSVRLANSQALDTHYSDLCWFDESLFALLRDNRCILQIEPKSHRVLAEFSYAQAERGSEFAYLGAYAVMEGLAVERDFFWLVTDNNGEARRKDPKDTRPTLVRFRRPPP